MTNMEVCFSVKNHQVVIDGGWLIHIKDWNKDSTYSQIVEQCESYLSKNYGVCCDVFDGYEEPSTKDHEHQRRSVKLSADITLTGSSKCHRDQDAFLSNTKNKIQFIELLCHSLQSKGHTTKCSDGDADTLIIATGLGYSQNNQSVVIVAEDTDIFMMLIHHWKVNMADIFLLKEKKSRSHKKGAEVYSIREACQVIDPVVRQHILFIHAWSGCDTTSSTFGQGKTQLLKLFPKSERIQSFADSFTDMDKTVLEIANSGNQVFCQLYGGGESSSLTTLRHNRYQTMIARSNRIEPERLPPTERAAHFHSLRVHLQVIQWKLLQNKCLDPLEWGWTLENQRMVPIMTDLDAAPATVLKFICCKCKSNNRKQCATNMCSCFKNGLKCVAACGHCRGENCHNISVQRLVLDDNDDESESDHESRKYRIIFFNYES